MRNINASLTTFGKVVLALTSPGSHHVPYRDSKLTRILQGSLGGNCKTTMITAVTPCVSSYAETVSSLKFARRAKHVKNFAIVNEDFNEQALLSAYEKEIHKLRRELAERRAAAAADPSEVDRLRQEQQLLVSERTAIQFELESRALEVGFGKERKEGGGGGAGLGRVFDQSLLSYLCRFLPLLASFFFFLPPNRLPQLCEKRSDCNAELTHWKSCCSKTA